MDKREHMMDLILAVILIISTLSLVIRLWQDVIIAVSSVLMMVSLAGLILSLGKKLRSLDENIAIREHSMRANMEELNRMVGHKLDATTVQMEDLLTQTPRRGYR